MKPNQLKLELNFEVVPKKKTVKGLNKILRPPSCKGWTKTK